jgi:hypothetical protein
MRTPAAMAASIIRGWVLIADMATVETRASCPRRAWTLESSESLVDLLDFDLWWEVLQVRRISCEDGDLVAGPVEFEQYGQTYAAGLLVSQYRGVFPWPEKNGYRTPASAIRLTFVIFEAGAVKRKLSTSSNCRELRISCTASCSAGLHHIIAHSLSSYLYWLYTRWSAAELMQVRRAMSTSVNSRCARLFEITSTLRLCSTCANPCEFFTTGARPLR